ncbi:SEC-C motif-containing protein [Alkalibacterium olivapovliticus]|uniref:SEC-C motif-containing protein n=1 Tax=Alkalibacterium olivapovliticus TaxID=99907 RepID=A0A2T0WC53_9LACT|nr:SEC-C motif-containing protein [Alkalibacterium olivapovliticus]
MEDHLNKQYAQEYEEEVNHFLFVQMVEETLEDLSIHHFPKSNHLEHCISAYTKEGLLKLAEINGIEIKKNWKKAKMVQTISNKIRETIEERVCLLSGSQIELLQAFMNKEFSTDEISNKKTLFYISVFPVAVRLGLLYSKQLPDRVSTVHSYELIETVDNIKKVRESDKIQQFTNIKRLIKAAIDLYGVVTREFILTLWRIAFPDEPFTIESYEKFYSLIHIVMADRSYLVLDDQSIASSDFTDEKGAVKFRNSIESHLGKNYYVPSKEELEHYMKDSAVNKSYSYTLLKQFVKKQTVDSDIVMDILDFNLKVGSAFVSVVEELTEDDRLLFKNKSQADQFAKLYADVFNQTRQWQLQGHTPLEMSDEIDGIMFDPEKMDTSLLVAGAQSYSAYSDYYDDEFIQQEPVKNPYRNVSRNDPCPCGSGKKFKKCCGR